MDLESNHAFDVNNWRTLEFVNERAGSGPAAAAKTAPADPGAIPARTQPDGQQVLVVADFGLRDSASSIANLKKS